MNGSFWIKWIFATILGINVGGFLGTWISGNISTAFAGSATYRGEVVNFPLFFASIILWNLTIGAFLGIAQWAVLRGHVANASRWIWATIAGSMTFGCMYYSDLALGLNRLRFYDSSVGLALIGTMTAIALGIAQGWVLGRSKIWCWLLANLVGIVGFLFVGYVGIFFAGWLISALSFIPVLVDSFERLGFMGRAMFFLIPGSIIGSATFGAITGNALIRLLKENSY